MSYKAKLRGRCWDDIVNEADSMAMRLFTRRRREGAERKREGTV